MTSCFSEDDARRMQADIDKMEIWMIGAKGLAALLLDKLPQEKWLPFLKYIRKTPLSEMGPGILKNMR